MMSLEAGKRTKRMMIWDAQVNCRYIGHIHNEVRRRWFKSVVDHLHLNILCLRGCRASLGGLLDLALRNLGQLVPVVGVVGVGRVQEGEFGIIALSLTNLVFELRGVR